MVRKLTLVVAALVIAIAQPASAQVFVDPDSPAGKEYAVPVDRAKRDAGVPTQPPATDDGETAPTGTAEEDESLFGAGITPESGGGSEGGASANGGGNGEGGGREAPDAGSGSSQTSTGSGTVRGSTPAAVSAPSPSSDALPWLVGGALLVLAVGAAGGFLARRSGERGSTA